MGEAKRRAAQERMFGSSQLGRERGLIISPPVSLGHQQIRFDQMYHDPQELRFFTLFWEHLIWPSIDGFNIPGHLDEEYLEKAGILKRPVYHIYGEISEMFKTCYLSAFEDCENREPGRWAMSQVSNQFLIDNSLAAKDQGALVELHRAIPIPNKDVPLADILEFRHKRRDELQALRGELDAFFQNVVNSSHPGHALVSAAGQIDSACTEVLKVSKEASFPFSLGSIKSSFSFDLNKVVDWGFGAMSGYLTQSLGLPTTMSFLSTLGTATGITLSKDICLKKARVRKHPYRYVASFHERVF